MRPSFGKFGGSLRVEKNMASAKGGLKKMETEGKKVGYSVKR